MITLSEPYDVESLLALFESLECVDHPVKCVPIPYHKITYLGFEIDWEYDSCSNPRERPEDTEYSLHIAGCQIFYCERVSSVHSEG